MEIAKLYPSLPNLELVAVDRRVGAVAEALLGIVKRLRMAGDPVAERCRYAKLDRVDGRLGNRLADLVPGGRMAHQIAELVRPIARLVVGYRRDRALQIQAVRREGPVTPAVQQQAFLAVDPVRRVEDFVCEPRIDADEARRALPEGASGTGGGGRRRRGLADLRRPDRLDLLAEFPVFPFESFQTLDQPVERLGVDGAGPRSQQNRRQKQQQSPTPAGSPGNPRAYPAKRADCSIGDTCSTAPLLHFMAAAQALSRPGSAKPRSSRYNLRHTTLLSPARSGAAPLRIVLSQTSVDWRSWPRQHSECPPQLTGLSAKPHGDP